MIFQITDFIFPSHTSSPTYFKMFRYSRFFFFFFHLRLVIIWTQKSDVVSGVGGSNSVIAWFPPGPKFSFRFQHLSGCSVFQTFSCSFFLMLLPHEISTSITAAFLWHLRNTTKSSHYQFVSFDFIKPSVTSSGSHDQYKDNSNSNKGILGHALFLECFLWVSLKWKMLPGSFKGSKTP